MAGLSPTRPVIMLVSCKTMKTTLDLPDELMRTVKIRAVREDKKLKDMVAELLRRGLSESPGSPPAARTRVQLPLVHCAHPADPAQEMTPDRVADALLADEARWVSR
jgi:plasmid stability protein